MFFSRELIIVIILLPASAYPQIGKVGINTTSPQAMLHVKDSSVLFSSPFYIDFPELLTDPPAIGDGVRMMWYPQKQSFRAGYVDGAQWDKINIGEGSFATGFNNTAKGRYTSALGLSNTANGAASLVIGQYNDPLISAQKFVTPATPLFIIGNGDDITTGGNLSNAFVVRKDGNVGIGNINPLKRLHVLNNGLSGATPHANSTLVLEDNNNQYLHFLNPLGFESGILQGRPGSSIRAGIVFTNSSNIQFRSGGNFTRMTIDSIGHIGAGETNPLVRMDGNGGLASDETVFSAIADDITFTVGNRTLLQISSNTDPDSREIHFTNGLTTGQLLIVQCIAVGGFGFMIRDTDANIDIAGAVILMNLNDTITFIWDGDEWIELHRSVN